MQRTLHIAAAVVLISSAALAAGAGKAAKAKAKPPDLSKQFLPPAPAGKTWRLVWHDEFDGNTIDTAKWEVLGNSRRRGHWWWKADSYLDGNGHLVLRTATDGKKFTSGAIRSQGKFEHRFGYWQCRCKLPAQEGHWPAFWLFSRPGVGKVGNDGRDGTEIDIVEMPWRTDQIQQALHWDGYGKHHRSAGQKARVPGLGKGFHTFGLHWKPDEYVFYADGKETWRTKAGGVSQVKAFVKLTEEIGKWGGDIRKAKLPDHFLVDYVRVFDPVAAERAAGSKAPPGAAGPRGAAGKKALTVEVRAGKFDRAGVPVTLELPKALAGEKHFRLTCADTGRAVPVQLAPTRPASVVWMLEAPLKAGQARRYELKAVVPLPKIVGPPAVRVEDDGKHLSVRVDRKAVLTYNQAVVESPIKNAPYYRRSGQIHPVRSPAGLTVTDDFCPDHPHQHGIMFAWTKSRFRGKPAEFWNQHRRLGTVEHDRTEGFGGGGVFGHFTVRLNHIALKAPGGSAVALKETWHVRVYRRTDAFLFDLVSTQRCAAGEPLEIEKYHYGGMAIRGARPWGKQGDMLTSEGKDRQAGNHTRPTWVDIHGVSDGKAAGVTIFCHPSNFRAPQPVRLHPKMPYFCFAPMVLGAFRIEPGKPFISRYRFYVHDGQLPPAAADALHNDYAHPVEVKLVN